MRPETMELTYRLETLHHVECENKTSLVAWTGCDTDEDNGADQIGNNESDHAE